MPQPSTPPFKNLHEEESTDSRDHLDQGNENGDLPDVGAPDATFVQNIADLRTSFEFIDVLKVALDNGGLNEEVLEWLCNPLTEPADVSTPDF